MKNNLLCANVEKLLDVDEKLFVNNDMLELVVVNKIQSGDFDEFVEEMIGYVDPENCCCDCCCDECGPSAFVIGKRLANGRENNSRQLLCAGYMDCMDEAIRFLVEEEKISPEHPAVRNLKAHLEESKERILDAASEVDFRQPNGQCERRRFPRTQDSHVIPIGAFLDDILHAWNTG